MRLTGELLNTKPVYWTIDAVVRKKAKINPKPPYQRYPVWNEAKKAAAN
jgi:hypothetical protein